MTTMKAVIESVRQEYRRNSFDKHSFFTNITSFLRVHALLRWSRGCRECFRQRKNYNNFINGQKIQTKKISLYNCVVRNVVNFSYGRQTKILSVAPRFPQRLPLKNKATHRKSQPISTEKNVWRCWMPFLQLMEVILKLSTVFSKFFLHYLLFD